MPIDAAMMTIMTKGNFEGLFLMLFLRLAMTIPYELRDTHHVGLHELINLTDFLDVAFALCLLIGKLPILVDKVLRNICVISIIYYKIIIS